MTKAKAVALAESDEEAVDGFAPPLLSIPVQIRPPFRSFEYRCSDDAVPVVPVRQYRQIRSLIPLIPVPEYWLSGESSTGSSGNSDTAVPIL